MRKKILCLALAVFVAMEMILPVVSAETVDITAIYVSNDGSVNGDGSIDRPFETVGQAKDYIRTLKMNGGIGRKGAVVYIRGGEYRFDEGLYFTQEDSGTAEAPITYSAYPGEKVEFVGSIDVRANEFKTITDDNVLSKITYSGMKDKIKYINLKEYGLKENLNAPLYGSYSYMLTEALGGPVEEIPFEILVGGEPMTLAKYPNGTEQMSADEIVNVGTPGYNMTSEAKKSGRAYAEDDPIWKNYIGFTIKMTSTDRVKYWGDAKYAIMDNSLSYDWARQSSPIENIDVSKGTITTKYPSVFVPIAGRPWSIYNLLEEIDVPGEYYIDKDTGNLYVYLSDDAYSKNEKVRLSVLKTPLFTFEGASYINIKNVAMSGVRSEAVNVSGGNDIHLYGCEIYNIPTKGLWFENSTGSGIDSCFIHDVDVGIYLIGGDYETLTDSRMYITNCEFQNFSRLTGAYTPAINMQGVGNRVTHNELHDSIHQAVWFQGNNNYFAYNEVYDVSTHSSDSSAIYGLRNMTGFGNVWEYNYIHDVGEFAPTDGALAANGIYFDDGNAGGYIAGNVFENINGAGVFAAGRDCNITNNIFVNCSFAAASFSKREIVPNSGHGLEMMNKIKENTPWLLDEGSNKAWEEAYPEQLDGLFESMTSDGYQDKNELTNNVIINSPEVVDGTSVGAKVENNYITAKDPGFYDFKNGNYTLKKDSKVYDELPEFKFIPFTRMGRVNDRAYQRAYKAVILAIDSSQALKNGEKTNIDKDNLNVVPKIKDSKTYVPIRFIAEAFGVDVAWEEETKNIDINNGQVLVNTLTGEVIKAGNTLEEKAEAFIEDGRTYLPLRMVSELLEHAVFWDDRGFISISTEKDLFNSEWDDDIISYLYNSISVHYK